MLLILNYNDGEKTIAMVKPKYKVTQTIHVHMLHPFLKGEDTWFIEKTENNYSINFSSPQCHEEWLRQFDLNRGQYDFFIIAMTKEEAQKLLKQLIKSRQKPERIPAKKSAPVLKNHQRLILKYKRRGMTYEKIAGKIPCSIDNVKQLFSRRMKSLGYKNSFSFIEDMKLKGEI
jgi:hypothetical protein